MGIHMKNNINYTGATSLNTLRDVAIDSPATGQGIVWDEEKQQWTNGEVSTNDMVEITLAEYEALSTEEKNNDTTYFITDADNIDPGSVGTAGALKPWLYNSDEEVVIGVYDGKPLYRKVFKNLTPVNKTDTFLTFEHGIENVDYISINPARSYVKDLNFNTNPSTYPINFSNPSNLAGSWSGIVDTTYINLYTGIDRSAIISDIVFTVEYTKTTDAEGSGTNLMPYSFVQNGGGGCNYSTEEQVVGTWIDGKPIYQKTYDTGDMQSETSKLYLLDDTIKHLTHKLIKVDGTWVIGSFEFEDDVVNQTSLSMPSKINSNYANAPDVYIDLTGLYIHLNHSSWGCQAYITIQYIKTTD